MTALDLNAACRIRQEALGGSCSGHYLWFDYICAVIIAVWVLLKAITAVGLIAVVPKITLLPTCVPVDIGTPYLQLYKLTSATLLNIEAPQPSYLSSKMLFPLLALASLSLVFALDTSSHCGQWDTIDTGIQYR